MTTPTELYSVMLGVIGLWTGMTILFVVAFLTWCAKSEED